MDAVSSRGAECKNNPLQICIAKCMQMLRPVSNCHDLNHHVTILYPSISTIVSSILGTRAIFPVGRFGLS
eukprot:411610-Pelagomonas_calceolata.AAC.1